VDGDADNGTADAEAAGGVEILPVVAARSSSSLRRMQSSAAVAAVVVIARVSVATANAAAL
jgi:hypothetical protein